MKIVLSRKGFDSSAGGSPSPIIDGRPISIPIPVKDRSETTYGDLGLGEIVERITRGRLNDADLCHHDPMFELGRCAFGQTGAAQGHLANNEVGVGDVFLFFGLFSEIDGNNPHHRIFGYLEVSDVTKLGTTPTSSMQPNGFQRPHPHTIGQWNANNTIYSGKGTVATSDVSGLRLSVPNCRRVSDWMVPLWLRDSGLTYHRDPARWEPEGTLRAVARGQEFITEVSEDSEATAWLRSIIAMISSET